MAKKLKQQGYKRLGGVIALPREMIKSPAYRSLSTNARALIVEFQLMWQPGTKTLHFSTRRAGEAIGASKDAGARALRELTEAGFITVAEEGDWLNGRARDYRLTWQPPDGWTREPTDEWKFSAPTTARPTSHQRDGQGANRRTRETASQKSGTDRSTSKTVTTENQGLAKPDRLTSETPYINHVGDSLEGELSGHGQEAQPDARLDNATQESDSHEAWLRGYERYEPEWKGTPDRSSRGIEPSSEELDALFGLSPLPGQV